MTRELIAFQDALIADSVATRFIEAGRWEKPKALKEVITYQVFIDGKPYPKTFKISGHLGPLWKQFNTWAKNKGAEKMVENSKYLGHMAWETDLGLAEVREVTEKTSSIVVASVNEPLYGHDSMANAYVVDDYPYGFRLRCKIRYWVEYVPKKGYRMVSQTTNPKIADREVWNKPKATTYVGIAGCLYLDSKDQVQFAVLTPNSTPEQCLEFSNDFPKYDFKLLGKWATMKLEFCYRMITGKAHFTVNDVKQETSDSDKGRYRAEAEIWSKLAKKCHAAYPAFVDEELGL